MCSLGVVVGLSDDFWVVCTYSCTFLGGEVVGDLDFIERRGRGLRLGKR